MHRFITELKLRYCDVFLGSIKDGMPPIYKIAGLLILPFFYGNICLMMWETMASGCPTIKRIDEGSPKSFDKWLSLCAHLVKRHSLYNRSDCLME